MSRSWWSGWVADFFGLRDAIFCVVVGFTGFEGLGWDWHFVVEHTDIHNWQFVLCEALGLLRLRRCHLIEFLLILVKTCQTLISGIHQILQILLALVKW